ncbi:hypothetical protein ACRRTK_025066 [Alexandromys fortis]
MNIVFILLGSIVFAFIFYILERLFQIKVNERSPDSTSPVPLQRNPIRTIQEQCCTSPSQQLQSCHVNITQLLSMYKRILVDLNIVENELAKLEQLLSIKDSLGHKKARQRPTVTVPVDTDSGSNQ